MCRGVKIIRFRPFLRRSLTLRIIIKPFCLVVGIAASGSQYCDVSNDFSNFLIRIPTDTCLALQVRYQIADAVVAVVARQLIVDIIIIACRRHIVCDRAQQVGPEA